MANAFFRPPKAVNEPVRQYEPNSAQTLSLQKKLDELASTQIEIPLIIGGKEVRTGNLAQCVMPHNHKHVLAHYHQADESHVQQAIDASQQAFHEWSEMAWEDRAAIMLRMAELLAGPYRDLINAATMLGQSKTPYQAEIDSACELVDFFRFNVQYMTDIYRDQPFSPAGMWNREEYRALEGFIFAVTPFNFTSIAGNLPTSPAIMGNVALWKPSKTAVYSGYFLMQLFKAAGLPDGVINFIPGPSPKIAKVVFDSPHFSGIHYTGSTAVFQNIWKTIGNNIHLYRGYPRIVGETGGKDFIFAHETAQVDQLVTAIVRGGYEYQGQKCSAASRIYVPNTLWGAVKEQLVETIRTIRMGDIRDWQTFMGAVIDRGAYRSITGYIDHARTANDATIIAGGNPSDEVGYFIDPTLIETSNPRFKTLVEEIFGPVVTVFPYDASDVDAALANCDTASPYALTGAVFSEDRSFIAKAMKTLRHTAGNFYINDKPTGAVVGQQPFGGGRASGTNDKAGSAINLLKWTSARSIKETFLPPSDYRYPYMG
jgi:1-pyrroline-5-carboxylate dehydrogenase